MENRLGRLTNIDPRSAWTNEASDFTPWLAKEENLTLLGDTLGFELELVNTEVQVGPYWADVLAKDVATDRFVVVENQLGKTDHDHLGKVLTYGALLNASVVIWIAREFTDEHRKVFDWLNDNTDEDLEFYAVCIELWRIGDSLPAPRFNVVSRPASILKQVRGRGGVSEDLTETQKLQHEFWTAVREKLEESRAIPSLQTPRPQYWFDIALGRTHLHISCIANTTQNRIGVRLYLGHQVADAALSQLMPDKEEINKEVGMELSWNPNPDRRDKIVLADRPADLSKREKWPEYLEWMTKTVLAFRAAFKDRIMRLDLSAGPEEEAETEEEA